MVPPCPGFEQNETVVGWHTFDFVSCERTKYANANIKQRGGFNTPFVFASVRGQLSGH